MRFWYTVGIPEHVKSNQIHAINFPEMDLYKSNISNEGIDVRISTQSLNKKID